MALAPRTIGATLPKVAGGSKTYPSSEGNKSLGGTSAASIDALPHRKKGASRFQPVTGDQLHRLIANVMGVEKQGKNHFAFTAPGPIAVLSMDQGLEGMVEKFVRAGKKISKVEYELTVQPGDADPKSVANAADKVWTQYVEDFRDAIRSFRTVVCDTGTEAWELIRLARFGKLTQVMPHHYGPVNGEMRNLIREAFDYPCNLAILHKMKAEWVNGADGKGNKTGRYEFAGFSDIPFIVQVNAQCWREPVEAGGLFHTTITDCRQNAELAGVDLAQPLNTWATLGQMVFPESEEADWL